MIGQDLVERILVLGLQQRIHGPGRQRGSAAKNATTWSRRSRRRRIVAPLASRQIQPNCRNLTLGWLPLMVSFTNHHSGTWVPFGGPSTLYHRRRLVSRSHMLARRVHPLGVTSRPPRASSTMMGHVPQRVGHDGCPVGSRATERQYRDRQASWRPVRSIGED